jgi:hypothetical protein
MRHLCTAVLLGLVFAAAACTPKPQPTAPDGHLPGVDGPALFADITTASGLSFTYRNGEEAEHQTMLETLGGGVALIDYDGDGLLDIFLPGGGRFAGSNGKEIVGLPCKLFKNKGNGRFEDFTTVSGLDALAGGQPWFYSHGAAVADYDRDGWPDLLVTGSGRVALFRNVPIDPADATKGRRFQDVTTEAGLDHGITWATSAAFADLDGDGYPDLYLCQYLNWSFANHPKCDYNTTIPQVCPPKLFEGLPHKVYRNTGTGSFVDMSAEAGLVGAGRESSKGLGVLIVDLDGDGKPDIYVANDTTPKLLYMNHSTPGAIRLREVGQTFGAARDSQGNANGSMGMDAGDYNGTGRPSLWVTNYEHEQHGLYRNEARPGGGLFFHFESERAGIAQMSQKSVGWGTAFLDVDLDGWEDLLVVNGHVMRNPLGNGVTRKQLPVLYQNIRGTFRDISRQIGHYHDDPHMARGVGFGDLDNDGRTDLVISHVNEPVAILRGVGGSERHWLGVRLAGKNHADIVGAKVELRVGDRTLTRFAKGGGSYLSSGDRRLLFGLGDVVNPGRLTVTWPNGTKHEVDGLAIDLYHTIGQK